MVIAKPTKYTNCPHCGELMVMETNHPEWLEMLVKTPCCNSYANVKWRETENES